MRRLRLAALLVVALAPAVFADQITLKNGDRLTGTIINSDAKTLVLKTEYADAVTIKWDFVQQIESTQPLYVERKAGRLSLDRSPPATANWRWPPRSPAV